MKKIISLAAATAITATSFIALASPYYEDYAKEDRTIQNIPATDTVETTLDIKSSRGNTYSDHAIQADALSATSSTVTVNAQATLDMTNVAKEWEAYLDAAVNANIDRDYARDATKLTGDFTIKIIGDKAISNDGLSSETPTGWTWDETTEKLFEQKSVTYDAEANTFTLVMTVKGSNKDFDEYFTSINDGTAETKVLTLTIPDTLITAQESLTTKGEYHSVVGEFSGAVTIENIAKKSTVSFESTDTEWYKLYKYNGSGGGGGGSVTTPKPTTAPTEDPNATKDPNATEDPNATTAPADRATPIPNAKAPVTSNGAALNIDEHYAYIIGYPFWESVPYEKDGVALAEVRPQGNITRAEVATIFFRMLTDESRAKFWTQDNDFSDVAIESWYNNAISTAAAAGIVTGYEDGTFKPDAPITRAEFAAIAARFSSVEPERNDYFNDISGHWAEASINRAAATGWINGYEDSTFRPNQYIIRAEAMALINRILYRIVDNNSILSDGMIEWSDNLDTSKWYYADMQEATNSHDYDREALGYVETWVQVNPPRDWEAFEKVWSDAYSAGKEDTVAADLDVPVNQEVEDVDAEVEDEADADNTDTDAEDTEADAEDSADAE